MSTQESTYKKKYAFTLAEVFLRHSDVQRHAAFTLAEVLITLGIIGVVAAMTMPTLIQRQNEKATVTAVKKYYSVIQQALLMARNEQGDYVSDNVDNFSFHKYIVPYLKIQKDCMNDKGCFADTVIKKINGGNWVNVNTVKYYSKLLLADGAAMQIYNWANSSNSAEVRIDINGFRGPNTLGQDIFYFLIKDNKVLPAGLSHDDANDEKLNFESNCNRNSTSEYAGDGCTAWVIYNENMDYLHCDDLSWNGKKKCK